MNALIAIALLASADFGIPPALAIPFSTSLQGLSQREPRSLLPEIVTAQAHLLRSNRKSVRLTPEWNLAPPLPISMMEHALVSLACNASDPHPTGTTASIILIGGSNSSGSASASVYSYDIVLRQWLELKPMPEPRQAAMAVFSQSWGGVVVCGGSYGTFSQLHSSCVLLHVQSMAWTESVLPDMPQARSSGGIAEVTTAKGLALLVVGGWTCDAAQSCGYLASCIMLHPASHSWIDVSPLPMGGRSNFGMSLLQSSLFLVWGGSNLQPAYAEAALFNATSLTWTSVAPLLQARSWSGFATSSSRAFAVGGMSLVPFFDPMDSVEMFSLESNSWNSLPSLPSPKGFGAAAECDGMLFFVGGAPNGTFAYSLAL